MTTVLVLGSAGFVGGHLARSLKVDHNVIGVSRSSGPDTDIQTDLTETSSWENLPLDVEVVINSAGLVGRQSVVGEERQATLANAFLPLAAAQYADRVGAHLVQLSTAGVYGFSERPSTEQATTRATDVYCITKLQGELACSVITDPARLTVLRLSFPYGPGQQVGLVPGLVTRVRAGKPVSLNTDDGRPRITPLFVDDCCAAVNAVVTRRLSGVYNCGGIEHVSIRDLSASIGVVVGCSPQFMVDGTPSTDLLIDSSALRHAAQWHPVTDLNLGLRRTLPTSIFGVTGNSQ